MFLALDGIDGAGKSTQIGLLADWLRSQGRDVVLCADPGGTPLGQELRAILLGHRGHMTLPCEALLFMASRAQLVADVIRPALDAGRTVLSDRFLLANVVYQGHAGGLDPEFLWDVGLWATGGLEPDRTIVLDLPLAAAARRRKTAADRLESRADVFHERVRQGFLTEARRRPDRIAVVDADRDPAAVHADIRQALA